MNPSQSCNIILFSRPAARHTNKDRLLYSTTSTSGGRFASRASAGMTLVEVLVAMVILLVGIWTLAVSFPKLLGVVATQEKRTEMAQQAQRTINQLTRHPADLPLGIAGAASIDATGKPLDPSISDFNITPPNARDDMIEVIGERFTVQAPLAFPYGPYPVHVFRQGLAGFVQVYEESFLPGSFSVDPDDGTVTFAGAEFVELNYDWVDTGGTTHHVYGELVQDIPATVDEVAAAALTGTSFSQVLSGTVDGIQLIQIFPPAVNLDPSGAFLLFDQSVVGARMRVNYTLLTEPTRNGRRALIMSEEHRIVSSPQPITLVASHIDDELSLPLGDLNGDGVVDLHDETYVLAVDTITGDLYWQGHYLSMVDAGAGEIVIAPDPALIGHDFRFYYVTLDEDLISVQIAPATFVDRVVIEAATRPDLRYRSYLRDEQPGAHNSVKTDPNGYTEPVNPKDLWFYACNAGHSVSVDYSYVRDATDPQARVWTIHGELHTISDEPYKIESDYNLFNPFPEDPASTEPWDWWGITLRPPGVAPEVREIIAVKGKSLQAIAWWRTPNGRLEKLEINTVR